MKAGWLHEEQDEGRQVACRASGRQAGYIESKLKAGSTMHTEQKKDKKIAHRAKGKQEGYMQSKMYA